MSAAHAIDDIHDGGLLTHSEERSLRWRLTMALTAACCATARLLPNRPP